MNIVDYEKTIYNPIIKKNAKGFIDEIEMKRFKLDCYEGEVFKGMQYRPDLVAYYYLNDPNKAWIITYVNEFQNGVKDYVLGRKLKIPRGV